MKYKPNLRILVFYAGLLYGDFENASALRLAVNPHTAEIYNGAYLYYVHEREWYRADFTPVLDADVPVNLKMSVLLMT